MLGSDNSTKKVYSAIFTDLSTGDVIDVASAGTSILNGYSETTGKCHIGTRYNSLTGLDDP